MTCSKQKVPKPQADFETEVTFCTCQDILKFILELFCLIASLKQIPTLSLAFGFRNGGTRWQVVKQIEPELIKPSVPQVRKDFVSKLQPEVNGRCAVLIAAPLARGRQGFFTFREGLKVKIEDRRERLHGGCGIRLSDSRRRVRRSLSSN